MVGNHRHRHEAPQVIDPHIPAQRKTTFRCDV
jgi:hypothetical protein